MSISGRELIKTVNGLLKKCGVGRVSKCSKSNPYPGDYAICVPLNISKVFVSATMRLATQVGLPLDIFQTFLDGKVVNERTGYIEASYLYDKDGIIQMMNVLAAAFQSGLPDGFLIKELRQHQWR